MIKTHKLSLVLIFNLLALGAHAGSYSEGIASEINTRFPSNKSMPIEFTFTLNKSEKLIMYTREIIVLTSEQLIRVKKSKALGKNSRQVVCSIAYEKLFLSNTNGTTDVFELKEPIKHRAVKGKGC